MTPKQITFILRGAVSTLISLGDLTSASSEIAELACHALAGESGTMEPYRVLNYIRVVTELCEETGLPQAETDLMREVYAAARAHYGETRPLYLISRHTADDACFTARGPAALTIIEEAAELVNDDIAQRAVEGGRFARPMSSLPFEALMGGAV